MQSAFSGIKALVSENVYEQSQTPSVDRAVDDELQSGEFSVENIERIYRYFQFYSRI